MLIPRRRITGNSNRVKLPGNTVGVFKSDVVFLQGGIQFDTGILDLVGVEGLRYPLQFFAVVAAQCDVVEAYPEWVELVIAGHFALGTLDSDRRRTGEEDQQLGLIQDGIKAQLVDVKSFGPGQVRYADGDVVYARGFDFDRHIHT